jgi:DNA-binding winged helix-turn-helix (wHTH) protein/Tol biopolymer transport system component
MAQLEATQVYEFGGFRLDPLRRVLSRRNGETIALKPKLLDALLYLVEHAGEPLDKTELIAGIWPGLVVEENNLNKTISVLRRVLGETPDDHKFIVTEPGRGYRFVATVSRSARDADEPAPVAGLPSIAQPPLPRMRPATPRYTAGAAAIAAAAVALAASHFWPDRSPEPAPRAVRFQIETAQTDNPLNIALSPDGEQIAYIGEAERSSALWVRPLDSLEARVVPGTERVNSASYPFWSADGGEIAYRTAFGLERVSLAGGLANTIVDDIKFYRRAAWGADGTILYATEKLVHRVPVAGGESVAVTTLDAAAGEEAHSSPQFLPDGKHFLYKATNVDWRKGAIYVGSLDREESPLRLLEASRALYVEPGYIVYSQESALYARGFDAERLEFTGRPVQIADDVYYRDTLDSSAFDAAGQTLIYRAVAKDQRPLPLLWVDRDGITTTAASPPLAPGDFRLSPDARRIVYDEGSPPDIWILDLESGARTRVTSSPQAERGALWSPDGSSIVFDAHREGGRALYERRADGALPEKLLLAAGAHNVAVSDWSDDGRFIIFEKDSCLGCDSDIWVLPRSDGAEPYAFAATQFDERSAVLSPDGRWIAYVTLESGICEVVVQSFADPAAGKWQISANGGFAPRWSADGRELYYFDGVGVVRVEVATEPAFHVGKPVRVSKALGAYRWDVTRDGQRLLRTSGVAERAERNLPITVILNWTTLIKD